MTSPTATSGHTLAQNTVTTPAAMISTFANASLRAASHAPVMSAPPPDRTRNSSTALTRLIASAPTAVTDSVNGSGGSPVANFTATITNAATAGIKISPANA